MPKEWIYALLGGVMIGVASTLMLYWNGRVTGISGILNKLMSRRAQDWRWGFLFGLLAGGFILRLLKPDLFVSTLDTPLWSLPLAGLLVGFGTAMGGGCTSGHGVCGISRLSLRSLIATPLFIAAGVIGVVLLRAGGILP